jgi:hypothetical protein
VKKTFFVTVVLTLLIFSDVYGAPLVQYAYRWRNDDGSEITASYKAATDIPSEIEQNENIRLRFDIWNVGSSPETAVVGIEYSTSTSGPWSAIPLPGPTTAPFVMSETPNYVDGEPTTVQIIRRGAVFEPGQCHETTDYESLPLLAAVMGGTETEFCFQATDFSVIGETYYFRLYPLDGYNKYPELEILPPIYTPTPVAIPAFNSYKSIVLLFFGVAIILVFQFRPGKADDGI